MAPDLTVSLISTNSLDFLLPCLDALSGNTRDIKLEVFIVDNASEVPIQDAVAERHPDVKLLRNETRRGFSTNNNMVLEQAAGRYLMLLNDDTTVLDGALDEMVSFMDAHPDAGAVGSFLLNPDHSFQPAFARFPNPLIEGLLPSTIWSTYGYKSATAPFAVDSVCGAAMMVRREAMAQVGMLDEAFDPIYSEEVDWCYRIKQGGWKIYALPQARIIHYGSQTMNRAVSRKYELLLSHKALFFRKHSPRGSVFFYKAGLTISTTIKLIYWLLLSLLRHPASPERRQLHIHLLRRIPSL